MSLQLLVAITASVGVVLSGPFVGEINTSLQNAFPGQHLRIIGGIVVVPALIGLGVALARIRERRLLRCGALALALFLAGAYVALMQPLYTEQFHLTEYTVITFLFYRVWRPRADATTFVLPVVCALVSGIADEWFQWLIPSRVGELRDVVLNGVGIQAGLLFALGLNPPVRTQWLAGDRSRRALAAGGSLLIVAAAIFMQSVHLGYEITDPDIGRFRSRFAASSLSALASDRAARWRIATPGAMPRISREDHYLSEATFHIQERNERWAEKDAGSAWKENLILETYYGPVLELAMPASRWPSEQRANVAADAAADSRAYVSDAYPLPVYVWSRTWFWGTVVALMGIVALLSTVRSAPAPQTATI